jgi:hypothetical protein
MTEIVYVELLNEGTTTFFAMPATQIQSGVFLLHEPTQDIDDVELEYPPGSMVRCERRLRANGLLGWFASEEAS